MPNNITNYLSSLLEETQTLLFEFLLAKGLSNFVQLTDYGYLVIEYKYYSGSFTEFLFNKYEQDP